MDHGIQKIIYLIVALIILLVLIYGVFYFYNDTSPQQYIEQYEGTYIDSTDLLGGAKYLKLESEGNNTFSFLVKVDFLQTGGTPYASRYLEGFIEVENNQTKFIKQISADNDPCELKFTFEKGSVRIRQTSSASSCGITDYVKANGHYIPDESLVINITPQPSTPSTPIYKKDYEWVLQRRNSNNEMEEVGVFYKYFDEDMILRDKDYLIFHSFRYSSEEGSSNSIVRHDLESGDSNTIFVGPEGIGINDIDLISNTLFFSTGEYLSDGATYWEDPKTNEINEIITGPNGRINKYGEHYILTQGEGDACWSFANFYLLNVEQREVAHIIDTTSGCSDGEFSLGIDNKLRMIIVEYESQPFDDPEEAKFSYTGEERIYKNIYAVPIENPSREPVFNIESLSQDITNIHLEHPENTIRLESRNEQGAYILDLATNTVTSTSPTPTPTPYIPNENYKDYDYDKDQFEKTKNLFETLDLPDNYTFVPRLRSDR